MARVTDGWILLWQCGRDDLRLSATRATHENFRLAGDRGSRNVPAQPFDSLPIPARGRHAGVQAETLNGGALPPESRHHVRNLDAIALAHERGRSPREASDCVAVTCFPARKPVAIRCPSVAWAHAASNGSSSASGSNAAGPSSSSRPRRIKSATTRFAAVAVTRATSSSLTGESALPGVSGSR
jgi:hypothetical protein